MTEDVSDLDHHGERCWLLDICALCFGSCCHESRPGASSRLVGLETLSTNANMFYRFQNVDLSLIDGCIGVVKIARRPATRPLLKVFVKGGRYLMKPPERELVGPGLEPLSSQNDNRSIS